MQYVLFCELTEHLVHLEIPRLAWEKLGDVCSCLDEILATAAEHGQFQVKQRGKIRGQRANVDTSLFSHCTSDKASQALWQFGILSGFRSLAAGAKIPEYADSE